MIYAVLWTDGVLSENEINHDCSKNGWVPVLAHRKEGKIHIPVFESEVLAQKFGKRNIPSNKWVRGTFAITERTQHWIKQQGWILDYYTFPKKINLPGEDVGFEVIDNGYHQTFHRVKDLT